MVVCPFQTSFLTFSIFLPCFKVILLSNFENADQIIKQSLLHSPGNVLLELNNFRNSVFLTKCLMFVLESQHASFLLPLTSFLEEGCLCNGKLQIARQNQKVGTLEQKEKNKPQKIMLVPRSRIIIECYLEVWAIKIFISSTKFQNKCFLIIWQLEETFSAGDIAIREHLKFTSENQMQKVCFSSKLVIMILCKGFLMA